MVGRGGQSANTVESGSQARDSSLEVAVAITWVVDTLEKFKSSRVWGAGGVEGLNLLDSDVGVSDDFTTLERLGSRIVILRGVWRIEGQYSRYLARS